MSGYRSRHGGSTWRGVITWVVMAAVVGLAVWRAVRFKDELEMDAKRAAGATEDVVEGATTEVSARGAEAGTRAGGEAQEATGLTEIIAPEERSARVGELTARAAKRFEDRDIAGARGDWNQALRLLGESEQAAEVRERLAAMNEGVFLGPEYLAEDPNAKLARLLEGDTLGKVAGRYKITGALLATMNPGLDPRKLVPGRGIKVVVGPFCGRYVKQARRLDVMAREMYVYSCTADVEIGCELPTGVYRVSREGKSQRGGKQWIAIEGIEGAARGVKGGWIYGSGGVWPGGQDRSPVGIVLGDAELAKLYNVLVEGESRIEVEP